MIKGKELLDENMNLLHAVGRAATSEPRMVAIHYEGNPSDKRTIALVGKGVTYDTGGLNLKPTGFMEDMFGDKNGSCAVIGALKGVLESRPKVNVVFAMGFADNAIDAHAFKPGDIIKSRKGLTVEIGNTDAEGRLVLCDTMTYVQQRYKPDTLIDLATLTGAVRVALGPYCAGLFTNDDDLKKELIKCGKDNFEQMWHLPIMEEHHDMMKSKFADLNNSGGSPYGGASSAAAYLEKFVEKDVKWVHLDISGAAKNKGEAKGTNCKNGNGWGVQTLLDYIWSQESK